MVYSRCLVGAWKDPKGGWQEPTVPTVGFSRATTKYKGFDVEVYDVGGSKTFRGIWPKYYHEASFNALRKSHSLNCVHLDDQCYFAS